MTSPVSRFTVAEPMMVASVFHRGSYSKIGDEMRDLKAWVDTKGIPQGGYPFCLFYDNPGETPEGDLRSEACIPVTKRFQSEGRFVMKEFPGVTVAETRHQGPPEDFGMTYGPFLEWLLSNGYRILGPAREFYATVKEATGPGAGFLIQQPVSRK